MKKIVSVFLLALLFMYIPSISQKVAFTIEGHTFYKNGVAKLFNYTSRSEYIPYDSTLIKEGVFYFKSKINEPKLFLLEYGEVKQLLFLGNEHVFLKETDSISKKITIEGSQLSQEYNEYNNKWIEPLKEKLITVNKALVKLDSTHQKEIDSLNTIQSTLFTSVPDSTALFIENHPSSFISLYFLNYYGDAYDVNKIKKLYTLLDKKLKQYPSATFIKQKILLGSNKKTKCPNFSVLDDNNSVVSLRSFEDNYLLIDFWASWCIPCLRNIPYVQKAAVQFKTRKFKVLTVSMDNKLSAWKAAINKYSLEKTCKNVLLKNTFRNKMALQFNVSYIPSNVLIDPNGNIIAKNIDGEGLLNRLKVIFSETGKL